MIVLPLTIQKNQLYVLHLINKYKLLKKRFVNFQDQIILKEWYKINEKGKPRFTFS